MNVDLYWSHWMVTLSVHNIETVAQRLRELLTGKELIISVSDENSNYLPDLFPNHHLCPPNVEVIPSSQTVGKMLVIYFKYNEPWKFETTYQLNDNDYSYQSPMITYSNGQVFFTHLIAPFCKQNLGL